MTGHMRSIMEDMAKDALEVWKTDEVTVGVVYDGYTPDGTIMKLEICVPDFDQSRYWCWKTFKKR